MFCHMQNKPKIINTFIYIYEVKALIHSSNRLHVRGFTPNGRKPNSKLTKENTNTLPNKKKKLFAHIDVQKIQNYYRNKLDNSKSLSIMQKKFTEYYMETKKISKSTKQNISAISLDQILSNGDIRRINDYGRNKVKNFKEYCQNSDRVAGMKARFGRQVYLRTTGKQKEEQDCKQDPSDKLNYTSDDATRDERELVDNLERKSIEEHEEYIQMKEMSKLAKEKLVLLSNKAKRLLSDIDRQKMKEHYRNKFKISSSLPGIRQKLKEYYRFLGETSYIRQVRLAEEKVSLARDKLKEAQDRTREIQIKLTVIRKELKQIKSDKWKYDIGSSQYLDFVNKEIEVIRDKEEMIALLKIAIDEKRELFYHLNSVSKSSHVQERSRAVAFMYWSRILALVTILIGILGTILKLHN